MSTKINVDLLMADQWQRLRDIRLHSLKESPTAFGGQLEVEGKFLEDQWRDKFSTLDYLIASIDGVDIALMSLETFAGDRDATCWIGGCWSDPLFRARGALRALFDYVDLHAKEKGWQRQGLGVWADNERAIAAYRAIGFENAGGNQASERQPGRFYIHMVRDSVAK